MTTSDSLSLDAKPLARQVADHAVRYSETVPLSDRRTQRIAVIARGACLPAILTGLSRSRHSQWYDIAQASDAGEAMQVLGQPAFTVHLMDEWGHSLVAGLPTEQRTRIERSAVVITELGAPGMAALTCFSTMPLTHVTAFSLDHLIWQIVRQSRAVSRQGQVTPPVFDVLQNLARMRLTENNDLGEALRPLAEAGAEAMNCGRVTIWQFRENPKRLCLLDMYDREPGRHQGGMEVPAALCPVYCMALENHRILPIENALSDERCAELVPFYLRQAGIGALLDAPIYLDGKVVGLLCHAHMGGPRRWNDNEQTLAASLADYVQILFMAQQRRAAEDALRLNQQALAQAQKMEALGRLSSGIAHDFNNLLMVISGNAQMLERKVERGTATDPRHLKNIIDACGRAESLARRLLTLGRRGSGSPQWLELNRVVGEVARLLGSGLGPGISLNAVTSKEDAWVHADSDELQSALINLATNARDAMPAGGELHLSVESVAQSDLPRELDRRLAPYARITVRDTGTGMSPEVQARAMEPFFTTKAPEKGTGLGLWNVYNCMRGHHGHLAISSHPGHGTAVHLYLPAVPDAPALIGAGASAAAETGRSGRILLVDDDLAVQRTIADMLSFLGHQVTVCGDGASAIERFRAERGAIDLVLLDLGMPGMPGDECLRALRGIDPSCRCLVISGNITDQVANDCLRDGALGIVPKPFSLTACAQAVEKALAVTV